MIWSGFLAEKVNGTRYTVRGVRYEVRDLMSGKN